MLQVNRVFGKPKWVFIPCLKAYPIWPQNKCIIQVNAGKAYGIYIYIM